MNPLIRNTWISQIQSNSQSWEVNGGCQGLRGGRIGEGLSNSAEFQFRKMEGALETDGGDAHTAAWMDLLPPNCTFQTSYDGQLHVTRYVTTI